MRKLIIGIIILSVVMLISLVFTKRLEKDIKFLYTDIETASSLADANESTKAVAKLQGALERWLEMGAYTHLLLHASKVEEVSATFYECLSAIESSGKSDRALNEKLLYQLGNILEQEKLSLGSIF